LARKSLIAKANRPPKFKVRAYNRCRRCGRSRAYLRRFGVFEGMIPGVKKSSW